MLTLKKKIAIVLSILTLFFGQFEIYCSGVFIDESDLNHLQKSITSASKYIQEATSDNYDRSLTSHGFWRFFDKIHEESHFSFLSKLMDLKSQRENWYEVSPYIAEFFCFTSNLAILGVGIYDNSWYTILAGLMSAVSHAVPTQFAHDLDMIGVATVSMVGLYNYSKVINSPRTLYSGLFALTMNAVDTSLSRTYGSAFGPWLHVGWHLTAAYALHNLNVTLYE